MMNFQVNALAAVAAHTFKPKQPTAHFQTLNQRFLASR
jgi:hypothetical protein